MNTQVMPSTIEQNKVTLCCYKMYYSKNCIVVNLKTIYFLSVLFLHVFVRLKIKKVNRELQLFNTLDTVYFFLLQWLIMSHEWCIFNRRKIFEHYTYSRLINIMYLQPLMLHFKTRLKLWNLYNNRGLCYLDITLPHYVSKSTEMLFENDERILSTKRQ